MKLNKSTPNIREKHKIWKWPLLGTSNPGLRIDHPIEAYDGLRAKFSGRVNENSIQLL